MARACHLLGTVSIFVAEVGRGGWPCGGERLNGRGSRPARCVRRCCLPAPGKTLCRPFGRSSGRKKLRALRKAGSFPGYVIALDAGHGGYDGGAVGRVSGTAEKGLNLDVTQRLKAILEAQGARVVMTRTDDYALCDEDPPIRKKLQDMQRRAAIIESGRRADGAFHSYERIRGAKPERAPGVLSGGMSGRTAFGGRNSGRDERKTLPQKDKNGARRRLLHSDAGRAKRAGGVRLFIQRERGSAAAD